MPSLQFIVNKKYNAYRLDIALLNLCDGMSRRKIRRIIDVGGVYVNGQRVRIASRVVTIGQKIELNYTDTALATVAKMKFSLRQNDIILSDEDFFVINKPPGLASQATKNQSVAHVIPVLKSYLKTACPEVNSEKLFLVHRLDQETSGLLIIARNEATMTKFTEYFKQGNIQKEYHALCIGTPKAETFEKKCFLSTIKPKTGLVEIVHSGGKTSFTSFRKIGVSADGKLSLIACYPKTGRSHQIRVHLADLGLPIVGDKKYCKQHDVKGLDEKTKELSGAHQMLHALSLSFIHPRTGQTVELKAPYPPNFKQLLLAMK